MVATSDGEPCGRVTALRTRLQDGARFVIDVQHLLSKRK